MITTVKCQHNESFFLYLWRMLHEIYPVFQDDYGTCDSQKYNVSSQTQVLADAQDRESDKYMFLYLCTFFLIPPHKKKD